MKAYSQVQEQIITIINHQNGNGEEQSGTVNGNDGSGSRSTPGAGIVKKIHFTRGLTNFALDTLMKLIIRGMPTNGWNTWEEFLRLWVVQNITRLYLWPLNWRAKIMVKDYQEDI